MRLPEEHAAALVLEDDVRFLRGWRSELAACVRGMGEDWDVFYLDCAHMEGWDFGRRGLQRASNVVYTDAYLISRRAARAALALVEADDSLDVEGVLLTVQEAGRSYTTLPKLALQRWDDSDIQTGGRVRGLAQVSSAALAPLTTRGPCQLPLSSLRGAANARSGTRTATMPPFRRRSTMNGTRRRTRRRRRSSSSSSSRRRRHRRPTQRRRRPARRRRRRRRRGAPGSG